jgi:UDPglucose 6-dehydrogenase
MSRITIIGTGYVGLTTGVCFAHLGHNVVCADIDEQKVERLQAGDCPIVEEGLSDLLAEGLASRRLKFVVGAAVAAADAEYAFLCVPTPPSPNGSADLSFVDGTAAEIAQALPAGSIVVNKSTVPVGTAQRVQRILRRSDVSVVSNPEFLREGTAIRDFLNPDRVIVGSADRQAALRVADLYATLSAQVIATDAPSAEMIKYASNAFLAVKLSFINAIAGLCEEVDAEVTEVARGMGSDNRIGARFLSPGPGWGGSCLAKDTTALLHTATSVGVDFPLLRAALDTNDQQLDRVVGKVRAALGGSLEGKTVAAWGLTFKAGTDDVRCSPAVNVLNSLRAEGARIVAYDPAVRAPLLGFDMVSDPYSACREADVLVILTEWPEFAEVDLIKVRGLMANPVIVDGRNLLDGDDVRTIGFAYGSIGRPVRGRAIKLATAPLVA